MRPSRSGRCPAARYLGAVLRRLARPLAGLGLLFVLVTLLPAAAGAAPSPAPAGVHHSSSTQSTDPDTEAAGNELTAPKAALLGVIEGVTEYLPISSTGHLLMANRVLDVGQTGATKEAADTYTVAIQAGAILAVLVLFRRRFVLMLEGAVGRSEEGRHLLLVLVAAFVPAAVLGLALEGPIKDRLFGPWPVVAAWFVGGALLLVVGQWVRVRRLGGGRSMAELTVRDGLIIGFAQCLALWPGTSRSLVTILAGLLVGASIFGAVEFSFFLGFVTLGAATAYDLLRHGRVLFDTYGWVNPLIGLVVAFVTAMAAIKWLVGYLEQHDLDIFGWYRMGVAALCAVLLWTGVL